MTSGMNNEDFGSRRRPFDSRGEMPLVPVRKFFKTVAGPGMTAYPAENDEPTVYYARMQSDVSFTETVGQQSLSSSNTDKYAHIFNLETEKYIEEGSVVLCFREYGQWFTIDKVPPTSCQWLDLFTDDDDTLLTSHTSDSGESWSLLNPAASNHATIQNNKASFPAGGPVKLPYPERPTGTYNAHQFSFSLDAIAGSWLLSVYPRYADVNNYVRFKMQWRTGDPETEVNVVIGGVSTDYDLLSSFEFEEGESYTVKILDCVDGVRILEPFDSGLISVSDFSSGNNLVFQGFNNDFFPDQEAVGPTVDNLRYCKVIC